MIAKYGAVSDIAKQRVRDRYKQRQKKRYSKKHKQQERQTEKICIVIEKGSKDRKTERHRQRKPARKKGSQRYSIGKGDSKED